MHMQTDHEIAIVFVKLEFRRRRAVLAHGPDDFRDTCGTPFRQLQFLQEFSDAPVAVPPRYCPARAKLREAHGPVRTWVTEHNQFVRTDAHLDRLALLITAVIQRVDDAFLDCGIWKVLYTRSLGPIGMLDDRLADPALLDEAYPTLGEPVAQFIERYLSARETVLILQGPPGTGKTRL